MYSKTDMSTPSLFWQYPVITEKIVYLQNKHNPYYVGVPWATFIDYKLPEQSLSEYFDKVNPDARNVTCCQHIRFREFAALFKRFGIQTLYTPHKKIGEDTLDGIQLKPCPLYAVNVEDPKRNQELVGIDPLTHPRKYLYSFQGAYQTDYLSDIRRRIFTLPKKPDVYIQNIGGWHFNEQVFTPIQNEKETRLETPTHLQLTKEYNQLLLCSEFSLCPSGTGPNSIRFWEALACGSIPVLLTDTLELPFHPLWESAILRLPEKDLVLVDELLRGIPKEEKEQRRRTCLRIYQDFRNDFVNQTHDQDVSVTIYHYCGGSYTATRVFGGVARYDYQLELAIPERVFFQGPQQKNALLAHLKTRRYPVVVTDNHLSCDIPNEYFVYLVHHGVARQTAHTYPEWDAYWKNLCLNGQHPILTYRRPNNTHILTISDYCTRLFINFYGDTYTRFPRTKVLHPSELNPSLFKSYDPLLDKSPRRVLGNWGQKKGDISKLQGHPSLQDYTFHPIKIQGNAFPSIQQYNDAKQTLYLRYDVFLQMSGSEGYSYATLDALLSGLVVVGTPVGLLYELPETCFVCIEFDRRYDAAYVREKLDYAWKHRTTLSHNARQWVTRHCAFEDWKKEMQRLLLGEGR